MTGDSVLTPGNRLTLRLDGTYWEIVGSGRFAELMAETPLMLVLLAVEGEQLLFAHPKRMGRGHIIAEYLGTL